MKIIVVYREKNNEYSKEHADQYHFGKESENNRKDIYSQSSELQSKIDSISFNPNTDYNVIGHSENGNTIDIVLPNMAVLECIKDSEIITSFVISKNLLEKTHEAYNKKYDTTRFYFYIKANQEYTFLLNNICILDSEIPEELFEDI